MFYCLHRTWGLVAHDSYADTLGPSGGGDRSRHDGVGSKRGNVYICRLCFSTSIFRPPQLGVFLIFGPSRGCQPPSPPVQVEAYIDTVPSLETIRFRTPAKIENFQIRTPSRKKILPQKVLSYFIKGWTPSQSESSLDPSQNESFKNTLNL